MSTEADITFYLRQSMLNNLSHLICHHSAYSLFGNEELSNAINKQSIDIVYDLMYILKPKQL